MHYIQTSYFFHNNCTTPKIGCVKINWHCQGLVSQSRIVIYKINGVITQPLTQPWQKHNHKHNMFVGLCCYYSNCRLFVCVIVLKT